MSKHGFVSLPRSLMEDCCWKKYSNREKILFLHILFSCVYSPYEYNIAGKRLILQPGQMMTTFKRLTESYNDTVCHKEDKLNKTTIYRILERFARDKKVQLQTVRHAGQEETLLTIVDLDIYDVTFKFSGTASGTASGTDAERVRNDIKRTREQNNNVVVVVDPENPKKETERTEMNYPSKITKKHVDGYDINASTEELFAYAVRLRKDWTTQEIEDAWIVLCEYQSPIREWLAFITGTIEKTRNNKKEVIQKSIKCQKKQHFAMIQKEEKEKPNLMQEYEKSKENFAAQGTRVSLSAMYQMTPRI